MLTTVVDAATVLSYTGTNAAGACQASSANFDGQLRKRPLAIQNEGTTSAFVTCSPGSVQFASIDLAGYQVTLSNRSGGTVTVNCTGVVGGDFWYAAEYFPKSVTIPNGTHRILTWDDSDDLDTLPPFSVQCALAPGVGIGSLYVGQHLEVGS